MTLRRMPRIAKLRRSLNPHISKRQCKQCFTVFDIVSKLREHLLSSHIFGYSCRKCGFSGKHEDEIVDHLKSCWAVSPAAKLRLERITVKNKKELKKLVWIEREIALETTSKSLQFGKNRFGPRRTISTEEWARRKYYVTKFFKNLREADVYYSDEDDDEEDEDEEEECHGYPGIQCKHHPIFRSGAPCHAGNVTVECVHLPPRHPRSSRNFEEEFCRRQRTFDPSSDANAPYSPFLMRARTTLNSVYERQEDQGNKPSYSRRFEEELLRRYFPTEEGTTKNQGSERHADEDVAENRVGGEVEKDEDQEQDKELNGSARNREKDQQVDYYGDVAPNQEIADDAPFGVRVEEENDPNDIQDGDEEDAEEINENGFEPHQNMVPAAEDREIEETQQRFSEVAVDVDDDILIIEPEQIQQVPQPVHGDRESTDDEEEQQDSEENEKNVDQVDDYGDVAPNQEIADDAPFGVRVEEENDPNDIQDGDEEDAEEINENGFEPDQNMAPEVPPPVLRLYTVYYYSDHEEEDGENGQKAEEEGGDIEEVPVQEEENGEDAQKEDEEEEEKYAVEHNPQQEVDDDIQIIEQEGDEHAPADRDVFDEEEDGEQENVGVAEEVGRMDEDDDEDEIQFLGYFRIQPPR